MFRHLVKQMSLFHPSICDPVRDINRSLDFCMAVQKVWRMDDIDKVIKMG